MVLCPGRHPFDHHEDGTAGTLRQRGVGGAASEGRAAGGQGRRAAPPFWLDFGHAGGALHATSQPRSETMASLAVLLNCCGSATRHRAIPVCHGGCAVGAPPPSPFFCGCRIPPAPARRAAGAVLRRVSGQWHAGARGAAMGGLAQPRLLLGPPGRLCPAVPLPPQVAQRARCAGMLRGQPDQHRLLCGHLVCRHCQSTSTVLPWC